MRIVNAHEIRDEVRLWRARGETVGFVATMGALHEGHLSLIRRARAENDAVVVSIFVNPLQFGPAEDFATYPRDQQGDEEKCRRLGVDYLFVPTVEEMYPKGRIQTEVDPGPIGKVLEGDFRPGFFAGVATVCVKLFNLVTSDRAYFGRKDAQQLAVIRRVVRDLNHSIEIVDCPTAREPDGLAMSSRNQYLSADERTAAKVLSKALFEARESVLGGTRDPELVKRLVEKRIAEEPLVALQYVAVVDPDSFVTVDQVDGPACIGLAALVGRIRLIDNVFVEREAHRERV